MIQTAAATELEVAARGYGPAEPALAAAGGLTRAIIYLRVSTAQQANTDYDAEGFSIGAQRDACLRKASSLDAEVVDEYVDKGESARSADRPALKAMLARLASERDVDLVIVHKVDRLARNRADDVAINLAIQEAGARLVSVSENIDETPSGILLHGIMSSIAEFYSRNLAGEIKKGMNQKAKKGGLPGLAPIGYLNVRLSDDGKEIRTIEVDPDRAPLVTWAFEAYASGEYSLTQLTEALADRGLKTKPAGKRIAKPLTKARIAKMLRSPFYVGLVVWGGLEYPGRHEPIVSIETYAMVQALMDSRDRYESREHHHEHFLKGTLRCARCDSRLSFSLYHGNGGAYEYFYCLGRAAKRTSCDLPYLAPGEVETAIEDYYGSLQIAPETAERVTRAIRALLDRFGSAATGEAKRQRQRIAALERERRKLLDAHLAGAVPMDLLKEKQDRITRELADSGAALANTELEWENLDDRISRALKLARDLQGAYRRAKPGTRRIFNQAMFEAVFVDVDGVARTEFGAFGQLLAEDLADRLESELHDHEPLVGARGSNKSVLVELIGQPGAHGEGPATIWGVALTVDDLEAAAAVLGEHLGPITDAVQRGRRIATLRHEAVGLHVPIAFLTAPPPRDPA